jgi:hypothetical protein
MLWRPNLLLYTQSKLKTRVPACAVAPVVEQEPSLYADTEQSRKISLAVSNILSARRDLLYEMIGISTD